MDSILVLDIDYLFILIAGNFFNLWFPIFQR